MRKETFKDKIKKRSRRWVLCLRPRLRISPPCLTSTQPDASDCAGSEVGLIQLAVAAAAAASNKDGNKHCTDVHGKLKACGRHLLGAAGTPPTSSSASSRGSEAGRRRPHGWAPVNDIHPSLSGRRRAERRGHCD